MGCTGIALLPQSTDMKTTVDTASEFEEPPSGQSHNLKIIYLFLKISYLIDVFVLLFLSPFYTLADGIMKEEADSMYEIHVSYCFSCGAPIFSKHSLPKLLIQ